MSDTGYRRPKYLPAPSRGVDVNSPSDRPKSELKATQLKNMQVRVDGSLTPRAGVASNSIVLANKTPLHSIKRLNEKSTSKWARVFGTGDSLAVELSSSAGTYSNIDSSYSGSPLFMVNWKPTNATSPFVYIGDSARMRKVDIDGVDKQIGLPAPFAPPSIAMARPLWREPISTIATASWTNGGVAGAPSLLAGSRVNTTITRIVYDSGTSGWCSVQPADLSNIGIGSVLTAQAGLDIESIHVREVHRASATTDIEAIIFDSGTTGLCTIQPERSLVEFRQNALVSVGSGGTQEWVRILSVSFGSDNQRSFRCSVANTHAAGESIATVSSFRVYTIITLAATWTLTRDAIQTATTGAGTGYITFNDTLTKDLSYMGAVSGGFGSQMTDDDYFHFSLNASDLAVISTVRLMFDVDDGTFSRNYFYHTVEQSALVAAAKGTSRITDVARRRINDFLVTNPAQRFDIAGARDVVREQVRSAIGLTGLRGFAPNDLIDYSPPTDDLTPVTPRDETGTGDNQWSEVMFARSTFIRAGTQSSKSWKDVVAMRIEITCTGVVTVRVNSVVMSGGFAPDIGELGIPYRYRYRGRDSSTGVVGDYSPATEQEALALRDKVTLTLTQHPSSEVDKLDVERFGGLQDSWLFIGSVANSAIPTFTDDKSELAARANYESSDHRVSQPWVRHTTPRSGTCNVAGNMVDDNGSSPLPETIIPGTQIIIDGVLTTISRLMGSGSTRDKWQVAESLGTKSAVLWEIPRPVQYGQPLGPIFGPFKGCLLACDGPYIRWTEGNDFDATHEVNYAEATSPSDPTMVGFVYAGRCGVFTATRLLDLDGDPINGFTIREVPSGRGIISPYALAVDGGDAIAWVSTDGVYMTSGEVPKNITSGDLQPLFPVGARSGQDANGISAPTLTLAEAQYIRLSWREDGSLQFTYRSSGGSRRALRYVPTIDAWFPEEYAVPIGMMYSEEGEGVRNLLAGGADATSAKLYTVGGATDPTQDDTTGFAWLVRWFSESYGDQNIVKRVGDLRVDADPGTDSIAATLGFDNHSTTSALTALTGASRALHLRDVSSGAGTLCKNVSLELGGTTAAGKRPIIYGWEPSVTLYKEDTNLRDTREEDCGWNGDKYMQGVRVRANTYAVGKPISILYDGGQVGAQFTVNLNGERLEPYSFTTPFIARLLQISSDDATPWNLLDWSWVYNREPSAATTWDTQYSSLGIPGFKHIFDVRLPVASASTVSLAVYVDGSPSPLTTKTLASTSNVKLMSAPLILPAKKFKLVKFRLTSPTVFRAYLNDLVVSVMPWSDGDGDYRTLHPFGDADFDEGATI